MPSAFPPPCPLVLLEHRWPAALGDNSVLCLELCRPKMAKNNTECWPFFAFSFLRSSACMGSKHHQNLVQKLQKRGKNGGLGWFWGLLGELLEAFGPQHGPKLKKARKSESVDPPRDPQGYPKILKVPKKSMKNAPRIHAWKKSETRRLLDPPQP